MNETILEQVYQERLEERLIARISEMKNISLEHAMDVYYQSQLADKIHRGVEGVQYLDYKILAQILCETEPLLFVGAA